MNPTVFAVTLGARLRQSLGLAVDTQAILAGLLLSIGACSIGQAAKTSSAPPNKVGLVDVSARPTAAPKSLESVQPSIQADGRSAAPTESASIALQSLPAIQANCRKPSSDPVAATCDEASTPGGCSVCPSFTGLAGYSAFRASMFLRGSFADAVPEALVAIYGCEGHVNNYGGLVLTRHLASGWVPVLYLPGVVPDRCGLRADSSGLSRLACREAYGLNSGTYFSAASVIDFKARRVDWLLSGQCEDSRDILSVNWAKSDVPTVEVTVSYGLLRDNDGDHCLDKGGVKRQATLVYDTHGDTFVPTDATLKTLSAMLPTPSRDNAVDPIVAAATRYHRSVPKELLPSPSEATFVSVGCPKQ